MTTIKVINRETGEVVKSFDVTNKSIRQQEAIFDTLLTKEDIDRSDVVMEWPEDGLVIKSSSLKHLFSLDESYF